MDWDRIYQTGQHRQQWHTETASPELRCLLATGLVAGGAALDQGCGAGTEAVYLARRGFDVTAVDVSPKALELARELAAQHGVSLTTIACPATETGLPDGQFQLINDRSCFHVLPPTAWNDYVAEAHRMLDDDGILFMRGFRGQPSGGFDEKYFIPRDYFEALFGKQFDVASLEEIDGYPGPNIPARIAVLRKRRPT